MRRLFTVPCLVCLLGCGSSHLPTLQFYVQRRLHGALDVAGGSPSTGRDTQGLTAGVRLGFQLEPLLRPGQRESQELP